MERAIIVRQNFKWTLEAQAAVGPRVIGRFPQGAVRSDRRNVYESHGLTVRDAMMREWANSIATHIEEGAAGAARFAKGRGRHGDFAGI